MKIVATAAYSAELSIKMDAALVYGFVYSFFLPNALSRRRRWSSNGVAIQRVITMLHTVVMVKYGRPRLIVFHIVTGAWETCTSRRKPQMSSPMKSRTGKKRIGRKDLNEEE